MHSFKWTREGQQEYGRWQTAEDLRPVPWYWSTYHGWATQNIHDLSFVMLLAKLVCNTTRQPNRAYRYLHTSLPGRPGTRYSTRHRSVLINYICVKILNIYTSICWPSACFLTLLPVYTVLLLYMTCHPPYDDMDVQYKQYSFTLSHSTGKFISYMASTAFCI